MIVMIENHPQDETGIAEIRQTIEQLEVEDTQSECYREILENLSDTGFIS